MQLQPGWETLLRHDEPAQGTLSAERVARLRERVRDGFYASPSVMHQLAARLLDRGEL